MNTPKIVKEKAEGFYSMELETFALKNGEIWIEGELTSEKVDSILAALHSLEYRKMKGIQRDTVTIFINSQGGDLIAGLNLYDALIHSNLKVRTVITGMGCSAASIIFLAGQERYMMPYSQIHLHEPLRGGAKADTIQELGHVYKDLLHYKKIIVDIVSERTSLLHDAVEEMIDNKERYFLADEAVKTGIATGILHTLTEDKDEGTLKE